MARHKRHKFESYILVLILVLIAAGAYLAFIQEQQNRVSQENAQLLQQANQLYAAGSYNAAAETYASVIAADPQNYAAHIGLGNSYVQLRKYNDALNAFGKTLNLKYYDFRTYYGLGLAYYGKEDYSKAYDNLQEAYRLNKNNAAVVSFLINTYNALGLNDEAIELASSNLAVDPNNAHHYRKLAIAHFMKRDLQQALKNAQKAVELDSSYAGNRLTLGLVYLALEEKEKALAEYGVAAKLAPSHSAYDGMAHAYHLFGDIENRTKYFKIADEYPMHSNSQSLDAFASLYRKDYYFAFAHFNLSIVKAPTYYLPYKGIGMIDIEVGEKEFAIKNLEKAASLNPLDKEIPQLLEAARKLR